jgi:hypothetical protein
MTTFSIETELLILSRIAKKAIWWRRFFESIRFDSMKKLHIRCDNRQILRVLKKEMLKLDIKLKHVDIHRHWLRQKIQTNRISVSWCSTANVSKRFHQDAVSTKARGIFETTSSDRHHAFDQSEESINLSIEMLDWRDMLKDKKMKRCYDKFRWWDELMK